MIIFDFDGVISDSTKWFRDVARILGGVRHEALLEWMISKSDEWLCGSWSDERFIAELDEAFGLETDLDTLEAACRRSMKVDSRVHTIATNLKNTAVFTDNPAVRARIIQELMPNAHVTYSQHVGVRKRDGFRAFAQASRIPSGLFIDDYPPNIEAALNAGFNAMRWQLNKDPVQELETAIHAHLRTAQKRR